MIEDRIVQSEDEESGRQLVQGNGRYEPNKRYKGN